MDSVCDIVVIEDSEIITSAKCIFTSCYNTYVFLSASLTKTFIASPCSLNIKMSPISASLILSFFCVTRSLNINMSPISVSEYFHLSSGV